MDGRDIDVEEQPIADPTTKETRDKWDWGWIDPTPRQIIGGIAVLGIGIAFSHFADLLVPGAGWLVWGIWFMFVAGVAFSDKK